MAYSLEDGESWWRLQELAVVPASRPLDWWVARSSCLVRVAACGWSTRQECWSAGEAGGRALGILRPDISREIR